MATRNASPDEMNLIESFQEKLRAAKASTRSARADMKRLYKTLEEAGAFAEAADVNGVKAAMTGALAALDSAGAVAGKAAIACYADPGPIILGGGR